MRYFSYPNAYTIYIGRQLQSSLRGRKEDHESIGFPSICLLSCYKCDKMFEKESERGKSMNIREQQERWECEHLSPYASKSIDSMGRDREEEDCDLRTAYQRDRDKILHSKSFRRLKHKTQVFLSPEGDHYRTRLTHTLEVAQIARTVARALRMNEDLTEAIALGHDLGHTPFGHAGESALNHICAEGFSHCEQSVRVVELLEKKGTGLNLTKEVRDGILNHRTVGNPSTLEGQIVRIADKIAYINHDIDDAIRGQILKETDIPREYSQILGDTVKVRLDRMVHDVVQNSLEQPKISMSREVEAGMMGLRQFMFKNVYTNYRAKSEEGKAKKMITELYTYYMDNPDVLPEEYQYLMRVRGQSEERTVCDYIAGMTDGYSIAVFKNIFVPRSWKL